MLSDLRLALRHLAKNPGFAAAAVVVLALGIGANTAFFSLFDAQVLAPFPYPDANRVVQLWRTHRRAFEMNPWSAPDFLDVQSQSTAFAECGAYTVERCTVGGDEPAALLGVACTPSVLRALGVQPALGRWFTDADAAATAPPTLILSHACWTQRFGGSPNLVGRSVRLNGRACVVAGVMPADFEFYSPNSRAQAIDLWMPLRIPRTGRSRDDNWLMAVGRLKPGVSIEHANADLDLIAHKLAAAYPESNYGRSFVVRPLIAEMAMREMFGCSPVLLAVWLVLLAACANVAILFLARGAGRQSEYAVRLALGATRGSLIRLALAESLVVALLGGAAGLLLTECAAGVLPALFPAFRTQSAAIRINLPVLEFTLLLSVLTALPAGLPPAFAAAKTQLIATIKQGGLTQTGSHLRHRFLRHLVAVQVAVAFLLVNTAFLFLATYRAARSVDAALSSEYVLSAGLTLTGPAYDTAAARAAFWRQLIDRARSLPGVTAVGLTTQLPLNGGHTTEILAETETFDPKVARAPIEQSAVSAGFFSATGIAILRGRTFTADDARNPTLGVVINRTLADRYWPNADPIGRRIRGNTLEPWFTANVVGVVDNVRQVDLGAPALPEIYFPQTWESPPSGFIVLRSAFPALRMVPAVRRELARLDPNLALTEPATMAEIVSRAARELRTLVALIQFFMATTLLMAAVGTYGSLAFQTRERTREIGLRLALGAARIDIVRLVVRQAVPWIAGGSVAGIVITLAAGYVLRALFADVRALNPAYPLAGLGLLGAAVAVACWLPARRASRVDPIEALRCE